MVTDTTVENNVANSKNVANSLGAMPNRNRSTRKAMKKGLCLGAERPALCMEGGGSRSCGNVGEEGRVHNKAVACKCIKKQRARGKYRRQATLMKLVASNGAGAGPVRVSNRSGSRVVSMVGGFELGFHVEKQFVGSLKGGLPLVCATGEGTMQVGLQLTKTHLLSALVMK